MTSNYDHLTHHFLIAMPNLGDPLFSQTVTYICEHNEQGAMGFVINRPINLNLKDVLAQMDITLDEPNVNLNDTAVLLGGPVQPERGFIIHHPAKSWAATKHITDDIAITTSKDIMTAFAAGNGPDEAIIALGYAGWGPNQLEAEIAANSWLHCPADKNILFHTPYVKRWHAAAGLLGFDINLLTCEAGHA